MLGWPGILSQACIFSLDCSLGAQVSLCPLSVVCGKHGNANTSAHKCHKQQELQWHCRLKAESLQGESSLHSALAEEFKKSLILSFNKASKEKLLKTWQFASHYCGTIKWCDRRNWRHSTLRNTKIKSANYLCRTPKVMKNKHWKTTRPVKTRICYYDQN